MLCEKNNYDWILQEDNDPKHRSRLCTQLKLDTHTVTLHWSSQSLNASPIENIWALMKTKPATPTYLEVAIGL